MSAMRNVDVAKTLNMEQILLLLEASKNTPIHMQVLFNVLMGLRRQEGEYDEEGTALLFT